MNAPAIVLGDANVDLVIHLPQRGAGRTDLSGAVPQLYGGGTAGNTAVALARLGVPVRFIGTVGDDGYGRWVMDDFRREGVDLRGLRSIAGAMTPMVIALIHPDGERWLLVWPPTGGADTCLQPGDVDEGFIRSAAWLHTTGMCLRAAPVRDAVLNAMHMAHQAGVTVSLDLNLRVELWGLDERVRATLATAIERADVVFGSGEEELVPLTGAESVAEAASTLANGQRVVVARLGAGGALAAGPDGVVHAPGWTVLVVNTVGAGDTFDAGFIAARLEGLSVAQALRWGNAAASLKIERPDTRDMPGRAEVLTRLQTG